MTKASELIKELQEQIELHGDLNVVIQDRESEYVITIVQDKKGEAWGVKNTKAEQFSLIAI